MPIEHLRSKKSWGLSKTEAGSLSPSLHVFVLMERRSPRGLIYQAESGDLQDVWLEEFDVSSEAAYFAVSKRAAG